MFGKKYDLVVTKDLKLKENEMTCDFQISETFYQHLRNFIRKRVPEPKDVEDILHDALYRAQRNIDKLRESTKLTSWLFQIVRMAIIDFYRQKSTPLELDDSIIANEQESQGNHNKAMAICLKEMINQLPEKYRAALELTELEDMSQVELAKHLGISKSGAKSRVQRGKRQLKALLIKCCDIDVDKHGNVVDFQPKERHSGSCGCRS